MEATSLQVRLGGEQMDMTTRGERPRQRSREARQELADGGPAWSERPRRSAFAEHIDDPTETVPLEGTIEEERAADRFARMIQWPALVLLALLEAGWLIALARVLDRLI